MNRAHLDHLASDTWRRTLEQDLLPWIDRVAVLGDDVLEIGPGPGLTTDILRARAAGVTAVELDHDLATALADRMAGTNVTVIERDARALDVASDRFTAATCFSVLHHVPTAEAQDEIFAEVHRVLRPGAALFATDARDTELLRAFHEDDTFVPLDDDTLEARLRAAGFAHVDIERDEYEMRFVARKAAA